MSFNKTTSFILPILDLDWPTLQDFGFQNSYIGDKTYSGNEDWDKFIYIKFNAEKMSRKLKKDLRSHTLYHDSYYPKLNEFIVVFKPTKEDADTIIKPFISGKYSEIDRKYVTDCFPENTIVDGKYRQSSNWQILNKSKSMREYWEEKLDANLGEQEVWSKPEKSEEVHAI